MGFLQTGEVHSPFFLFIRHSPNPSDQDILDALGLDAYGLIEPDDIHHRPHLVIGHTDNWTVVADDYSYTLWHSERTTHAIATYAARVEGAFICRWPDVDETFAFSVWRRGECVRSFDLVKPGWSEPVTLEESGQKLEIETEELASQSAEDRLKTISGELGFVASDAIGTFRVYAGPEIVRDIGPYESALTNIPREEWERRREESIREQLERGAVFE